jgi:hypothetical protein
VGHDPSEFRILDGPFQASFPDVEAGILERLLRIGRHVPASVQLGYHLCFGDAPKGDGGHGVEPGQPLLAPAPVQVAELVQQADAAGGASPDRVSTPAVRTGR